MARYTKYMHNIIDLIFRCQAGLGISFNIVGSTLNYPWIPNYTLSSSANYYSSTRARASC